MTHLPARTAPIRRIALVDPLGDAGIGGYTHELASALARHECAVEVLAPTPAFAAALPRPYALRQAVNGAQLHLDGPLHPSPLPAPPADDDRSPTLTPYLARLARRVRTAPPAPTAIRTDTPTIHHLTAPPPLTAERDRAARALAADFMERGVDTLWAQWPTLPLALADLFRIAPHAGLTTVHTVHNVLPHEANATETDRQRRLYAGADALIVHSQQAATTLHETLGPTRARVITSRHGTYSLYPRRAHTRHAVRTLLDIPPGDTVILAFGAVRPYKNTDALVQALALLPDAPITLVVAGWEYGFDHAVPGDKLGRLRHLAWSLGMQDRVRLLPGPFGVAQTAELFEAADIVPLPYLESSGSGVLCMALSFGKRVLCTAVGGMAEYLTRPQDGDVLRGADAASLAQALRDGLVGGDRTDADTRPPAALQWDQITGDLLRQLRSTVRSAPVAAAR